MEPIKSEKDFLKQKGILSKKILNMKETEKGFIFVGIEDGAGLAMTGSVRKIDRPKVLISIIRALQMKDEEVLMTILTLGNTKAEHTSPYMQPKESCDKK